MQCGDCPSSGLTRSKSSGNDYKLRGRFAAKNSAGKGAAGSTAGLHERHQKCQEKDVSGHREPTLAAPQLCCFWRKAPVASAGTPGCTSSLAVMAEGAQTQRVYTSLEHQGRHVFARPQKCRHCLHRRERLAGPWHRMGGLATQDTAWGPQQWLRTLWELGRRRLLKRHSQENTALLMLRLLLYPPGQRWQILPTSLCPSICL